MKHLDLNRNKNGAEAYKNDERYNTEQTTVGRMLNVPTFSNIPSFSGSFNQELAIAPNLEEKYERIEAERSMPG